MASLNGFQPEQLTTYFAYLDDLRESGATNMIGATLYLQQMFPEELDQSDHAARNVLAAWMKTFDRGKSPKTRAAEALVGTL